MAGLTSDKKQRMLQPSVMSADNRQLIENRINQIELLIILVYNK